METTSSVFSCCNHGNTDLGLQCFSLCYKEGEFWLQAGCQGGCLCSATGVVPGLRRGSLRQLELLEEGGGKSV